MRIQSQQQTKIKEIQDKISNLSQTLIRLNIQVDNLLTLESDSNINTTATEKLIIGIHVKPTTGPNKDVKGVIVSFTKHFKIVKPNNRQLKPFQKSKHLLQLLQ